LYPRRKSPYAGRLNEPIVVPTTGPSSANPKIFIAAERLIKFGLLLEHYGLAADDPDPWLKLAVCLALEHVRGMQVSERARAKKGAPRKWSLERAVDYVDLIDRIARERGRGVADAITVAVKRRTVKGSVRSLEARYYECKKLIGLWKQVRVLGAIEPFSE
jgi:hypothetical protein